MVAVVEALLGDLVRAVVRRYPKNLGEKRSITLGKLLQSKSLQEMHESVADVVLNELSFKSPQKFAKEVEPLLFIDLLDSVAYHHYVEIKATRDILVHNRGHANDVYARKAGSHARARPRAPLPVQTQ